MWMSIVTQLGQHDAYMVQPPFSYSTLGSFQCDSGETSWPSVMMGTTPVSLGVKAAAGAGAGNGPDAGCDARALGEGVAAAPTVVVPGVSADVEGATVPAPAASAPAAGEVPSAPPPPPQAARTEANAAGP